MAPAEDTALDDSRRHLEIHNRVAEAFLTLAGDEVYGAVLDIVREVFESPLGIFGYIDEDGALVCPSLTRDVWQECAMAGKDYRFPPESWGQSLWGRAIRERRPLFTNEPCRVPAGHLPIRRVLCVPIVDQGESIGIVNVANRDRDYDDRDAAELWTICSHIAPVLNARLQRDRHEKHRRRAEAELLRARDELEQRVIERTAELSEANARLRQEIAERGRVEHALRAANRLLERLFSTTAVAIAYLDSRGCFIRVNRAFAEIAGLSPDYFPGRQYDEILGHDEIAAALAEAAATGRPAEAFGRPLEVRSAAGGDPVHCDWSIQPVLGAGGGVEGLVLTMRDVSRRLRAEALARRHQEELAHVSRLGVMGEMVSAIAHEVNQPLCAIVAFAQACRRLLGDRPDCPPEAREALEQIAGQARRAGDIVHHLREFSRRREPRRAAVSINDIVRSAVGFMAPVLHPRGLGVRLELAENLPPVSADQIQIEQVLVNLLRNAVEAMSDLPPEQRVPVVRTLLPQEGIVEVEVRDCGSGLSADGLERVFEPFFSTKPDGMGIGLPLSRSIVEAHGGRLWVVPNCDRGVSFHFTLPVHDADRPGD